TEYGKQQASKLAKKLVDMHMSPNYCLMSSVDHAKETAQLLLAGLSLPNLPLRESEVLRPESSVFGVTELLEDAEKAGARYQVDVRLLLVGDEGRLSQLISRMTSFRFRPLEQAEVVCVSANCREELLSGRGVLTWRIPVQAHQEADLRDKIGSKMTVTAILTGFNAAALVELTTDKKLDGISGLGFAFTDSSSALHWLAILFLMAASA